MDIRVVSSINDAAVNTAAHGLTARASLGHRGGALYLNFAYYYIMGLSTISSTDIFRCKRTGTSLAVVENVPS